jgi:hypothetical protein|uniref:Proline dehydrogenase domain-containing protein n=1 Tax=viral metagenome TaxID=1070528 RepID=A0A6C0BFJ1_9ZZZZ
MILRRFIGGNSIYRAVKAPLANNVVPIFDFAKEGSLTQQQAIKYFKQVSHDIDVVASYTTTNLKKPPAFAMKLSSVNMHSPDAMMSFIANKLITNNMSLFLDAESVTIDKDEQRIINNILKTFNDPRIYKTYQCYRKDTFDRLQRDIDNFENLGIKLVRGAYYEQDKYSGMLFTSKKDTDASYNKCINLVVNQMKHNKNLKMCIASHNEYSINFTKEMIKASPELKNQISFAQLLGMSDHLTSTLAMNNYTVYKYVPYGNMYETLPYLTRRLIENYQILRYAL